MSPLSAERLHREVVKLLVLIAVGVAAFLLTRAFAHDSREVGLRDAAAWYAVGQSHLAENDVEGALDALRRAARKDRTNRSYGLALAGAQTRAAHYDAAERTLLALRESAPESGEVNLALARVAVARHDVTGAVRYYHHARYGLWPTMEDAPQVRIELIRFLLRHGERGLALAELLAATVDPTADAADNERFGALFLEAGDPRRARVHFERALHNNPGSQASLVGAGMAAFQMGDYVDANRYLRHLPETASSDARTAREITSLVLANDPLGRRLSAAESRRRLTNGLAHVIARGKTCSGEGTNAFRAELEALHSRVQGHRTDRDTIEDGIDLIYSAEQRFDACGALSDLDRAWILIGQRYGSRT